MRALCIAAAVALLGSALLAPVRAQGARIVVIMSAQSEVSDLSLAELRRIFLGEPTERAGTRFIPLNYAPNDPLRVAFDRSALGMSPDASGRYWIDRRIRGQGLPPRAVPNQKLVRSVIARLAGGIGYVMPDQLDATVKAISIEGRSYQDPRYPLTFDPAR